MRASEIMDAAEPLDAAEVVEEIAAEIVDEAAACGSVKPLTPAQARVRQKRKDKAMADLHDTQASNAIKLRKAQRKLNDL